MSNTELIGVPFKRGGRGPDCFDCFGLIRFLIERDTGLKVPDYTTPDDSARVHALMISARMFWRELPGPKPGCVVGFRIGREVCHVGYVISNELFIHAWEPSGGVTIERLAQWQRRIEGFYEYTEAA
jgi:cell wall-associated NlpC family hydrolase